MIKALCFTQIDNTTDAACLFLSVKIIITRDNSKQMLSSQLVPGRVFTDTTDKNISEGRSSLHINIKTKKQIIQLIRKTFLIKNMLGDY